ncbi:hypothetical protein OUZ56_019886 [Daphnia magna]|uniref:Uncharacterized protein n=1 Tax=Daphnia magna TaxID=35525 RepID=A0ABQ9ZCW8_9CRUS|nr:hypothetical protein OUZ56_019886 [Daphnia magna]
MTKIFPVPSPDGSTTNCPLAILTGSLPLLSFSIRLFLLFCPVRKAISRHPDLLPPSEHVMHHLEYVEQRSAIAYLLTNIYFAVRVQ